MTPDEIKDIRARLRLTQEQFAARIGVSVATIRAWEAGNARPGPDKVARLRYATSSNVVRAERLVESLRGTADRFEDDARARIAEGDPAGAERVQRIAEHLRRIAGNHEAKGIDPVQFGPPGWYLE